jgi:hypothetical protein
LPTSLRPDAELAAVVAAWPGLSPTVRSRILALVRAESEGDS